MSESFVSPEISVHTTQRASGNWRFNIRSQHGELEASYAPSVDWFWINNLDVDHDHRRQGIGKALVAKAVEVAQEYSAKEINATIISRECLDVMRSVFGEENIDISIEGPYAPANTPNHYGTSAMLLYKLPDCT